MAIRNEILRRRLARLSLQVIQEAARDEGDSTLEAAQ
jgi:hypothetical protein